MGAIGYARARAMGVPYGTGKVVPVGPVVTMTRRGSYGGSRRRSYRRRSNYGGNDMSKYMPFGVGAALGYMGPKIHPMQDTIVMALAVLPAALGVPRQVVVLMVGTEEYQVLHETLRLPPKEFLCTLR